VKRKLNGLVVAVLVLATFIVAYQAGYQSAAEAQNVRLAEQGRPVGKLVAVITRAKTGEVIVCENHNLVVTNGKKYLRNILGFNNITTQNATIYISVSNDASPAASWTKLPNEETGDGFARTAGTPSVEDSGTNATAYGVTYTFTSTADGVTLQCGGLHFSPDSDSDGNLWCAATFTQTTFDTDDTLQLTFVPNHT